MRPRSRGPSLYQRDPLRGGNLCGVQPMLGATQIARLLAVAGADLLHRHAGLKAFFIRLHV